MDTSQAKQREWVGQAVSLQWPERAIALIRLIRPHEMNTLSFELLSEFETVLSEIVSAKARAIVITGEGAAFCCGAHLKYFAGPTASLLDPFTARERYLSRIAKLFDSLEDLLIPTIAAINGYALGGGCELALSCDFRIMSTAAKLGLPEVKLGAICGAGGVQKLARHVGRGTALDWILRGRQIDAATAESRGLCSAVVAPDNLVKEALALGLELRSLGPYAIAQSKRSIYACETADSVTARRFGVEALCMLVGSAEWNEGMQAFIEKRPTRFDEW